MSKVTRDQAGTYVQVSRKLRIQRGPGRPDTVSERPTDLRSRRPTDDPTSAPTLITLHVGDLADVPSLLELGAILPYTAPPEADKVPEAAKEKEGG